MQRLNGLAQEILKFWSPLDHLAHEPALRDDFEIEPPHFFERAAYQVIAIATGARAGSGAT